MSNSPHAVGISATHLSWRYRGATADALAGVTLDIPPGSVTLLTGPSGSGKSTLGALIAGLLDPVQDGDLTGTLSVGSLADVARSAPVGVVLQQPEDQTILHRVGDDVAFGLENLAVPPEEMEERVQCALDAVGLQLPIDYPTDHLSGGQRQRLAMAGALAMRPGVMVLDEPLQALDQEGRTLVVDAVSSLHRNAGLTLVIIDHDPEPWRDLIDQVIVFHSGTLRGVWKTEDAPVEWRREAPPDSSARLAPGKILCDARDLVVGRDGVALPGKHALQCRAGEIVAIVGPNGSGKSTLALTLAGLLPPISGGIVLPPAPHQMASKQLSSEVSFVPQNPAHHSVADTVRGDLETSLHRAVSEESTRAARVDQALERYGLTGLADRHPLSLSGGEARRLALAGAALTDAPVLILDEPSQSLDHDSWLGLVGHLRELASSGRAVIVVTHDRALITALGAQEYVLSGESALKPSSPVDTRPSWLAAANPLSLFAAATLIALGLLASLDIVSSSVAVGGIVSALAFGGLLDVRSLLRLLPIGLAAVFAGITIALYGQRSGELWWEWGIMAVTEGSAELAVATTLRVMAIATPAVVLFRGVDATAFADSLSQKLRLPERFVVGALAGVRLVQMVGADLAILRMTRRSRGLGDQVWWRSLPRELFSLVVISIRRATVLATAMESRAFGRSSRRTHFRRSTWGGVDALIVTIAGVIVMVALWAALAAGTWSP